jgi:hypothetical protein
MLRFPATTSRVRHASSDVANRRIEADTARRVDFFADNPTLIDRRLGELDREWDTERVLEANAATLALGGTVLGILEDRRFLALPVVVTAFLLQHALQGWCPPLPVLRRLGVRTAREIERERIALKALRGDFAAVATSAGGDRTARAGAALRAAS